MKDIFAVSFVSRVQEALEMLTADNTAVTGDKLAASLGLVYDVPETVDVDADASNPRTQALAANKFYADMLRMLVKRGPNGEDPVIPGYKISHGPKGGISREDAVVNHSGSKKDFDPSKLVELLQAKLPEGSDKTWALDVFTSAYSKSQRPSVVAWLNASSEFAIVNRNAVRRAS